MPLKPTLPPYFKMGAFVSKLQLLANTNALLSADKVRFFERSLH